MELKTLNRFTTIPFLMDTLKRKKLSLLNTQYWEDYNDRETMNIYRKNIEAKSIYALCFTYGNETVHHWNAFAGGTAGCCIEFSPEKLMKVLEQYDNISHGSVEYVSLPDIHNVVPAELPFTKRRPFAPEKEYRIIAASPDEQQPSFDIDIDVNIIRRITINNKMPDVIFKSIKQSLSQIAPEYKGKIYHSTLYGNPVWINHFRNNM